jgi:hypothetical protein
VLALYLSPRVLAAALFGGYSLNMFDPIEGPYPSPNTRLGLATVVTWHNADHYRQMIIYLRLNDIVPPPSRGNLPALQGNYWDFAAFLSFAHKRTISSSCTFMYNNEYLHIFVQADILGKGALCLPQSTRCCSRTSWNRAPARISAACLEKSLPPFQGAI